MEQLGDTTDDDTAPSATPPPPAPPARPDRVIGGVAGTIANRLGLDPLWVRLAFVVLGLVGGIGVVLYGAWWLVLVGGERSRPMRLAGGALLVAVVPLIVADGPDSFVTGPIAVVLLLAGLALALWQPNRGAPPAPLAGFPPPTVGGPPSGPAPATSPERSADASDGVPGAPTGVWGGGEPTWQILADGTEAHEQSDARHMGWRWPQRERSMLGRLTICAAIYVGAAWALADQIDGGRLHPEQWLGAAAVVCGAGMLVGTFRGRARWLIVPAVLAGSAGYVTGTTARLGIAASDLVGDRYVSIGTYTATPEIDERIGVGELQLTIDSAPATPVHVDARVGLGRIDLQLASDVTVELRPKLDHGSITSNQALAISETAPTLIGDGATPDVVIDAWVGRGEIDVTVFEPVVYPDGGPGITLPGGAIVPDVLVPEAAGTLVPIRDGLAMTADGWVVLGNGEAVIAPDDEVTVVRAPGELPPDGYPGDFGPEVGPGELIDTGWGQYRLLPRSLLVTPDGEVIDLQALRARVAETAATTLPPGSTVPPVTTLPAVPTVPPATTLAAVPTVPASTTPGG